MNIYWGQAFAPAQAERGKFAPIDTSTLSPAYSGDGRYAVLTYQIGGQAVAPSVSGTPIPTNNTALNQSTTITASTLNSITFANPVNYIEVYNADARAGLPVVYVAFSNPVSYAAIASTGMIINKTALYTINLETKTFWIAASGGTGDVDVRIIGYRAV